MKSIGTKLFILSILLLISESVNGAVRILAIGNSFSEDAVEQYFADIAKSDGEEIIVGNLYIGGCSIDRHYENFVGNKAQYRFRKILPDGKVVEKNPITLQQGLRDEKWDYISFQQASPNSGQFNSLGRLPELMKLVRKEVGDHPIFMWHQTWAYAGSSNHAGFENYGKNQLRMYHEIEETSKTVMETYPELKILIPSGSAIQNARTALIAGQDLTRDGYHLEMSIGRYIASLTWYCSIFRKIPSPDWFCPSGVSSNFKKIAFEAAVEAVLRPYTITDLSGF